MFKCGIYMCEWYGPMSVLNGKIQRHILNEALPRSVQALLFAIYVMLEIARYISCQIMNIFI